MTPQPEPASDPTRLLWDRFFTCFNGGQYYEAHDALEELWLPLRGQPIAPFYQGLIQLAGAFVHLQRHSTQHPRLRPAAALLKAARANLAPFQPYQHGLEMGPVLELVDRWLAKLESCRFSENPWTPDRSPKLQPPPG